MKIFLLLILFFTAETFTQSYITEEVITGLNLPTAFAFLPNGNFIINQKLDSALIYTPSNKLVSCFWNFKDSCLSNAELGLIGVCVDPNYSVNRYIYFYYIHAPNTYRIVRLTENNNTGTNPLIIFNEPVTSMAVLHVAGNIHFGPEGKLYISIGDNGTASNSQSLSTFKGKILRINSDGTIPNDNPFYDDGNPGTGNDDRIWALGLRNSYDFTFSPINDSLYATENGPQGNDEVNFIRKGKNYGWPVCQGYCSPFNPLYKQPMLVIPSQPISQGYAPTGILIYSGSQFPELYGRLIIGGIGSTQLSGIKNCLLGNAPFFDTITSSVVLDPFHSITSMVQGADGYIYFAYYGFAPNAGQIRVLKYKTTGVNEPLLPVSYKLDQNYPNPFNPVTTIKYSVPKQSFVTLQVYDALGRELKTLVNENKTAGSYEVNWNAESFPSGVYFYKFTTDEFTEQKKMVLIK